MTSARTRLAGLLAALALVGIVAGLPIVLLMLDATPWPSRIPSWSELKSALTAPDDGTLALAAITVTAWVAWALLTGSVALEVASRARGVATPTLPGLGLPQVTASKLVSAALLMFVAAPALVHGPPTADAQPFDPPLEGTATSAGWSHVVKVRAGATTNHSIAKTHSMAKAASMREPARTSQPSTVPYTVKRGDSLWSIADQHLGSGIRYLDIAKLNAEVLHGRPGFLIPGTVLRLPASTTANSQNGEGRQVVVERGDTLSEIAEEELGNADRYPAIFKASKYITQPGGVHLTDPDEIDVGWTLTIPAPKSDPRRDTGTPKAHKSTPKAADKHDKRGAERSRTTADRTSGRAPTASQAPSTTRPTTAETQAPTTDSDRTQGSPGTSEAGARSPAWLLTGLTGGGAVLAASMLVMLRRRRRNQSRHRRPGRTIARPEPVLAPVEKTVSMMGGLAAPTVYATDNVLRRLAAGQAARGKPMPNVAAVELTRTATTLHLSDPSDLPAPWSSGAGRRSWSLDHSVGLDEVGPDVADQPVPYPLLVTIGTSDAGHVWLLNCEQLGVISITGDPTDGRDFARYLAAELACNAWSAGVTVDCLGVAEEVVDMNPERVRPCPPGTNPAPYLADEASGTFDRAREADTDVATARAHQTGSEAWTAQVLLVDVTTDRTAALDRLLDLVQQHPRLTGTAVILIGEMASPRGLAVTLDQGRVIVPSLQLNLVAVGLTSDEALGCAALLAQAESTDEAEIPPDPDTRGVHAYADQAGALREEHTLSRNLLPDELPEPAESLLSADDDEYVQVAAATEEDLAALAPLVPLRVRSTVEDADPTLDHDVETWFKPDCDLPRLTLLGPVGARTHGKAIAKRKPYYTELLAYLASRPHGATPDEVAEAFSITPARVRNDIKILRDWLGINPRTGRKHLPDARDSMAAQARGIGVYQVEDLLTDADLFRRLRTRGETRGPEGIADLTAALKLVTGQPYDKLRPGGWSWLYEGDRLDQHMTCAIVDVAHIVTTHSLRLKDYPVARAAAEIAVLAAPYEDIPRLDLAAVVDAVGDTRGAGVILTEHIYNRRDDGLPPLELSQRTTRVVEHHGWHTREERVN